MNATDFASVSVTVAVTPALTKSVRTASQKNLTKCVSPGFSNLRRNEFCCRKKLGKKTITSFKNDQNLLQMRIVMNVMLT